MADGSLTGRGLPDDQIPLDDGAALNAARDADPHRTRARLVRPMTFALVCSTLLNVVLVVALVSQLPLIRFVPLVAVVKSDEDIQVIVEPVLTASDREAYEPAFIAEYVRNRETLVPDFELMARMFQGPSSYIRTRSSQEVYTAFVQASRDSVTQFMKQGFTRAVKIESVLREDDGTAPEHTYRVNVTLQDSDRIDGADNLPRILRDTDMVIYVSVAVVQNRVSYADYRDPDIVPNLFVVTRYRRIRLANDQVDDTR